MLLTRHQLAMSLCELVKDDSSLLNDILIEYTFSIDNNKRLTILKIMLTQTSMKSFTNCLLFPLVIIINCLQDEGYNIPSIVHTIYL